MLAVNITSCADASRLWVIEHVNFPGLPFLQLKNIRVMLDDLISWSLKFYNQKPLQIAKKKKLTHGKCPEDERNSFRTSGKKVKNKNREQSKGC